MDAARGRTVIVLLALASVVAAGTVPLGVYWFERASRGTADLPPSPTVEMKVGPLSRDGGGNVAVLLHNESKTWVLPIWIGSGEAQAIFLARQGEKGDRPMTHDLCANIIERMDATVEKITITRLEAATFYAVLDLKRGGDRIHVDARPSDSIVLALKTGRPIYVAKSVLKEAGIDARDRGGNLEDVPLPRRRSGT